MTRPPTLVAAGCDHFVPPHHPHFYPARHPRLRATQHPGWCCEAGSWARRVDAPSGRLCVGSSTLGDARGRGRISARPVRITIGTTPIVTRHEVEPSV